MERQPNRRRGRAPQQVHGGGRAPQQVQGDGPHPQQQLQGGGPLPQQQLQGGGPVPQQQVQGVVPVAQQDPDTIPVEMQFKAYQFLRFEPKYLKLPRRAPLVEGTRFLYNRNTDRTGNPIGDLVKRKAYNRAEKLGDKRRQYLHVLPKTKDNELLLKKLDNELSGLLDSLDSAIAELDAIVPGNFARPKHFSQPPALNK